jgi:hypothetical protein
MASYTSLQLYGTGSIGENLSGSKLFLFNNPSYSSYFTMETNRNVNGFYDAASFTNFSGSYIASQSMGLITSSYISSVVVQPGVSSFVFKPGYRVVSGSNYYLRGTGDFTLDVFDPSNLFTSGEKGVWFDASDRSTLFQNIAGTTPVTAVGQPVGKWLDKSGNGNHAVASADDTTRPTYQIDAEGNYNVTFTRTPATQLITPAIDFTATNKMFVCTGLHVIESGSAGVAVELGASVATVNGSFSIGAPSSTADHSVNLRGTSTLNARIANVVDGDDIISGIFDISQATKELELIPRLNYVQLTGSQITWTGTDAGTGNFGNLPLYIGSEGASKTIPFGGKIYQLIVRGALPTGNQLYATENFVDYFLD